MPKRNNGNGKPVMNRWVIVVGAILIQVCLGAIYAWSVFTPPLSAPLPDNDFQEVVLDDGVTVLKDGVLKSGAEMEITLTFSRGGENLSDLNVSIVLELMDKDDKAVKSDKIVPYIGYVYKEGDPITAGPYAPSVSAGAYTFTAKVTKGGNWHYVVTATEVEGNVTNTYSFELLEKVGTGKYGFSITQTQMIFAAGLLSFAVFTIVGGRMAARFGPRKMAIAGGITLGAGYILASFMGTNFYLILACIGILGGAGIGLGYVVPIATGVKWFPDKKGMISGLAVAGFGFGALLWIKLATGFSFGSFGDQEIGQGMFGIFDTWKGLYDTFTVSQVFLIYGIAFAVAVILGGLVMQNPPEGWLPKGWKPPEATGAKATGNVEFTEGQMRKTPQYYMLFFMFMVGAGAGLMVIGVISLFGKYALVQNDYDAAEALIIAGTAMALFYSLANGVGRIVWGMVSDKTGRKLAFVIMFAIQGVMMVAFFFIAGNEYLLYLGAAVIGFNFGGNFALFPAATADFFGNKAVGKNYGWVFLSYGFGGLLGPMLGGVMGDMEYWKWAFIPAGVLLLVCAGIALLLKPPKSPAGSAAVEEKIPEAEEKEDEEEDEGEEPEDDEDGSEEEEAEKDEDEPEDEAPKKKGKKGKKK